MSSLAEISRHEIREPNLSLQPLWYKDAVIYQLHVKSFVDSNNDGIGDFSGLISRLDYIAGLGINTIWLLPFYPSPRLDDGYDISEYKGVHSDYGRISDVKRFIRMAHERGMKVITELVINHTSDQHPWFQRARRAKPGSAHREFYVWSDNDQKYAGTRIIFLDTERSNWTWDPVANAYFWHRFYSHQPDLNFDNPAVLTAVLDVMRFWLDLGIDGLRLDAVPYLIERDGTSNENLPETHTILKKIRKTLDEEYEGRMLLAEANMWPEDTQAYFGDGDECHMAFHFPLMPRMYMAIAQEDRFPVTDIMRQTPDIPENCQWAIFLRNHDELTLEMVTDKERDYLWEFYATDRRARLNLGIRRRLAPLLERDRRRIELMNSMLLSMPGTPVIYYGDEIGMGDNIFLGDRNGVRTPMQWSSDRNGGFSRADPASLTVPLIMDPLYGFQAINVEAQNHDAHSLLNWMRRILSVRKEHGAFGRGSLRFLYPKNRKVFAYLREYGDETILCVANLSRSAQAVELDLSEFEGRVPVELLGNSTFPPVGQLPYMLTLSPYGFFWFVLASDASSPFWHTPAPEPMPEFFTFVLRSGPEDMVTPAHRELFERDVLPAYLAKRRWFSAKDQKLRSARMALTIRIGNSREMALVEIEATTDGGGTQLYLLPLGISWDDTVSISLPQQLALARVRRGRRTGYLTDAFALPEFIRELIELFNSSGQVNASRGQATFIGTEALRTMQINPQAPVRWLSAEQSNSSLVIDDKAVLKLFRHIVPGQHPEAEMTRFLTDNGFTNSPALLGELVHHVDDTPQVFAVLQAYIGGEGDAWNWTMSFLDRVADELTRHELKPVQLMEPYVGFADHLGQRLGEMHRILRETKAENFAPIVADKAQVAEWQKRIKARVLRAIDAVESRLPTFDETTRSIASGVLKKKAEVLSQIDHLSSKGIGSILHRIHGDLHLGQVLVSSGDAFIIDFEGEPAQPLEERRSRDSGWRDVAGILRSFDYVVAASRKHGGVVATDRYTEFVAAFQSDVSARFLRSYLAAVGLAESVPDLSLLRLFLIEKAAYEIIYELGNRPEWLNVPLAGFSAILQDTSFESLAPKETSRAGAE
jgi:maltose alpha-D-glucosyltransferase/alpha-amylase